jgi:predicted transcriptional regulator
MRYSITAAQCRAARAMLGMTQAELSRMSGVPAAVIARFETDATTPRASTFRPLITAFSKAGIVFLDADGASGVLLFSGARTAAD